MQNNKLLVGITGGIGSGKTLACRFFEKLGFNVLYADEIARRLYKTNSILKYKLVSEFGGSILDEKGNISGVDSRKIIFSSKKNIKRVNKIVHPFAIREIDKLIKKINDKVILIETAILFESGYYKRVDYTILIFSDKESRIERVRRRDTVTRYEIERLMNLQMNEKEKLNKADFIIKNNSSVKNLEMNIRTFSKILRNLN
ncbi:MAG: dephospho-CoA kinase [Chlorobi bacterium]|nr:dephospho-CoA kinase [Chlorobiota bacterium]MCI0714959.1 dephospho-CoA kinase [Chlorobiota bacterium]